MAAGRYNRQVLLGGVALVAAVVLAVLFGVDRSRPAAGLGVLTGVILVLLLSLFFSPTVRHPPAVLLVSEADRSFGTHRTVVHTLAAVAHLAAFSILLLYPAELWAGGLRDKGAVLVAAGLFACYPRAMWRGLGVVINADGIRAEKFAGVVIVPWEALAAEPAEPERGGGVVLTYDRPDLVRVVGGWSVNRRQLLVEATDVQFLAAVVDHYRANPEERAGIGTPAELDRLRVALDQAPPGEKAAEGEPIGRGAAVAAVVFLLLTAVGTLAAGKWAEGRFGEDSLIAWLLGLISVALAFAAGGAILTAVREFRKPR
ncbi:hypothetical protein Ato02nite_042050 [Paractinoplanes toevensis]|uniref:Uncharacterized protein n=1 Tax=Paractinoplanes toevensis TaxID=571911 RepID=A0A919TC85_9ACTN|nr:hypothetical protein Ato02nite_042050 [Actinoplanes toevensis]